MEQNLIQNKTRKFIRDNPELWKKSQDIKAEYNSLEGTVKDLSQAPVGFRYDPRVNPVRMAKGYENKISPIGYNDVQVNEFGQITSEDFAGRSKQLYEIWQDSVFDSLTQINFNLDSVNNLEKDWVSNKHRPVLGEESLNQRFNKLGYFMTAEYLQKTIGLASQSMYDLIQFTIANDGKHLPPFKGKEEYMLNNGQKVVKNINIDVESEMINGAYFSLGSFGNLEMFKEFQTYKENLKKFYPEEQQKTMDAGFSQIVEKQFDTMLETARLCYMSGRSRDGDVLVRQAESMESLGYAIDESDKNYIDWIKEGNADHYTKNDGLSPAGLVAPKEMYNNFLVPSLNPYHTKKRSSINIPKEKLQEILKQVSGQKKVSNYKAKSDKSYDFVFNDGASSIPMTDSLSNSVSNSNQNFYHGKRLVADRMVQ